MNKIIMICLAVVGMVGISSASTMNYQGRLSATNGSPVNGSVAISVSLYTNASTGAALYTENMGSVAVANGIFSFDWGNAGTSLVSAIEVIGTTTGSNAVYNGTAQHFPMNSSSVTIADGTYSWSDVSGSSSPGNFLGSVGSYPNGTVSAIYLSGNPSAGRTITLSYKYNAAGGDVTLQTYSNLWLGVRIDGQEAVPRRALGVVPRSVVANTVKGQTLYVDDLTGRVGIGTNNPSSTLTVKGVIETTTGGVKFPDGTFLTTGNLSSLGYITNGSVYATKQEMNMAALSAEFSAYTSGGGIVDQTSNYIAEVFIVSNGVNGLVTSASSYSYLSNKYCAAGSIISNVAQVSVVPYSVYTTVKTVPVYGGVYSVSNEISSGGLGWITCRIKFNYSDGSAGYSSQSTNPAGWATESYINPQLRKSVTTVEVQAYVAGGNGWTVYERNTRLQITAPSWVLLSIPNVGTQKVSGVYLAVRGVRESTDSVTFTLTDGVNTTPTLSANTIVPITGITNAPNMMTINMNPATTNASYGGTAITTVVLKYW